MNIPQSAERRAIFAAEGGAGKGPNPLTHGRLMIGSSPAVRPFPTNSKVPQNPIPTQTTAVTERPQAGPPLQRNVQSPNQLAFGGRFRRVVL